MGICILAKRAVLELGSSTNFVYSLRILLCRILSYCMLLIMKENKWMY